MFSQKNLSVMAYANSFTLWNYQTEDTVGTIKEPDYFKDSARFMRVGDMIMVTANNQADIQSTILAVGSISNDIVSVQSLIS